MVYILRVLRDIGSLEFEKTFDIRGPCEEASFDVRFLVICKIDAASGRD